MEITFPGRRSTKIPASTGASDVVSICHPAIGHAFLQHGAGRKHLRGIVLAGWQSDLTSAHPAALIGGLIRSDGCRAENRFRTLLPSGRVAEYSYIRYFFSNLSADIREIFTEHCQLLGIRVTQSNHRNLSGVAPRQRRDPRAHRRSEALRRVSRECGRGDSNPHGLAPTGT